MEDFRWNEHKNEKLKRERGVSFELVLEEIGAGRLIDVITSPGRGHEAQKAYVVDLNGYVHYVPFKKMEDHIFLKTIIPARKLHKKYRRSEK